MTTRSTLDRRGFTLIELLTVIAIIGILAAIIIPTVGKVRDSAKRTKCMSNVRQLTIGLVTSANQNTGQRFPSNAGGGLWAWDVQHTVIREIVNQAGRDTLYCPSSTMVRDFPIDTLYEYGGSDKSYAVASYVLLIPDTKQIAPQYLTSRVQANYEVTFGSVVVSQSPSRRPLVIDAVISNGSNFSEVAGGLANNVSNHMEGPRPSGAHTGFVDGHVKWRPFVQGNLSNMTDAAVFSMKSVSNTPNFWF